MSRGSALVDTLVAAFVAAFLLQGAVAAAHLQGAGEQVQQAAAAAASWAARYGDSRAADTLARALAPAAESISLRYSGGSVAAVVRRRVPLAGPNGDVGPVVVGRAVAAVSPYRSNR